jgi:N6-adenosine-specific RNA methylase IME4|tara:strand:+ start:148 stop:675 length:528 start_codon:yes stop_codon:yes gene_type:complete
MLPFPDKKYQIIYADPPWKIKKIQRKCRPNQINMDYSTMELKDIKDLCVEKIADDNSVLFLWTIQRYLKDSFDVMKAWGFKYQRTITWDKQNGMCLFGFHHRTEFLLFGYKGKLEIYPKRKAFPTLVQVKTDKHSKKPQIFRDLISAFGDTKIELFARKKTEGWDVWGDEVVGCE